MLKGVGPFAVSLYKGARSFGVFDEQEQLPADTAVRQIAEKKSRRRMAQIFSQNQSGGVNIGGQAHVQVRGDLFGGNKIDAREAQSFVIKPEGPVEQLFGGRVDTRGGAYIGGTVDNRGGQFAGRDLTTTTSIQQSTREDMVALVRELRNALKDLKLDPDERNAVEQDVANAVC